MAPGIPAGLGDRYGLVQIFLNLARNSQRAMQAETKRLLRSDEGSIVARLKTRVSVSLS
jgi:nitrogen-specific signal transduction histidine kinase